MLSLVMCALKKLLDITRMNDTVMDTPGGTVRTQP